MESRKPVLVVEDDEETCTALVGVLLLEQIRAVGSRNGAAAIDRHNNDGLRPCVIVLDLSMPVMNGEQFLKVRRIDPELARVPVLIITGKPVTPEDFPGLNVKAVFQKPVDPSTLIKVICPYYEGVMI